MKDITSELQRDTLALLASERGAESGKWQPPSPGSNPDEEILSELRTVSHHSRAINYESLDPRPMTNRLTSQKRRAQNRASQRAFRERKKQHVQELEHKLQKLLMRHEEIINLYTKQSMEIARLDQKLDHLALELLMCQTNGNHATDGTVIFPPKESISEASSSSSVGTRSSLNCSGMECWTDNHINAGYGSSVDTQ